MMTFHTPSMFHTPLLPAPHPPGGARQQLTVLPKTSVDSQTPLAFQNKQPGSSQTNSSNQHGPNGKFSMSCLVHETNMIEQGSNRMVGKQMAFFMNPASQQGSRIRHRRTFKELSRDYTCPNEKCGRKYATRSSLATHVRLKHNGEGIRGILKNGKGTDSDTEASVTTTPSLKGPIAKIKSEHKPIAMKPDSNGSWPPPLEGSPSAPGCLTNEESLMSLCDEDTYEVLNQSGNLFSLSLDDFLLTGPAGSLDAATLASMSSPAETHGLRGVGPDNDCMFPQNGFGFDATLATPTIPSVGSYSPSSVNSVFSPHLSLSASSQTPSPFSMQIQGLGANDIDMAGQLLGYGMMKRGINLGSQLGQQQPHRLFPVNSTPSFQMVDPQFCLTPALNSQSDTSMLTRLDHDLTPGDMDMIFNELQNLVGSGMK
eukprot:comp22027_c0_seq1/m.31964 comp22027_c0_seq1/g.31964  ORF comp22027_c0_seq1/g.31964 comp22027_c0_seq1/m.31964 type:complete len:427 (-) comp22027_c0_seq1:645-1925(-)